MTTRTIVLFVLIYLAIGRLVHEATEPALREKSIFKYNRIELGIFYVDLFLWLPFLMLAIIKPRK
jgi:hypothetical protein